MELAREILQWLKDGVLLPRVPYSRADLLSVVQRLRPHSAERDFLVIRAWGQSGSAPGKLQIETSGRKKGFRYHFGASAEDLAGMGSIAQTQNEPVKSEPSKETGSSIRKPIQATIASPSTETLLPMSQGAIDIFEGDNLPIMKEMAAESVDLIYVDPPFNTGKKQARTQIATIRDEDGDRTGFQNRRYRTIKIGTKAFDDSFDSFLDFLVPRLEEAHRLLKHTGSLFLHLDYREIHYAKVALDKIFGRECFINEIIWAYDYGARSKKKWSAKHDNILWYVKNPEDYCFNYEEMDRIPYMAPGLVGKEKAARGKTPTDTWWHTIVSPNSHEKTGYPTQKPIGVLNRIVKVHSRPGDLVMDFFAGSGTLGESAALLGRNAVLIDSNPEAIAVMRRRLDCFRPKFVGKSSAAGAIQDSEDVDSNVAVTVAPKSETQFTGKQQKPADLVLQSDKKATVASTASVSQKASMPNARKKQRTLFDLGNPPTR